MNLKGALETFLYGKGDEDGAKESSSGSDGLVGSTESTTTLQSNPSSTMNLASKADEYVTQFSEAIQGTDEIGSKFIQVLSRIATTQNPTDSDYQRAFDALKVMNPTLTVVTIKESVERLISMVTTESNTYKKQGADKKSELEKSCVQEKQALVSTVSRLEEEINRIQDTIQKKQNELAQSRAKLTSLDEKYKPQMEKIDRTLSDLQTATNFVCERLSNVLSQANKLKD